MPSKQNALRKFHLKAKKLYGFDAYKLFTAGHAVPALRPSFRRWQSWPPFPANGASRVQELLVQIALSKEGIASQTLYGHNALRLPG
jgi:hypothetical protein